MKKIELIEVINQRLPHKLHPKSLALVLGRAYNQILFDTFNKNFQNLDLFTKTFTHVPIKHDTDQDLYYSELPAAIVKLPIAGDGVRRISGMKGKSIEFVPITSGDAFLYADLEVGNIKQTVIPFYVINNRVEYIWDAKIADMKEVKMQLVVPLEEYDMLDEIYIPSGRDELLIETTINLAFGTPPEKETNDNSNKTD